MGINSKPFYYFVLVTLTICVFFSCSVEKSTSVRNFPVDTPFVFDNKIILKGNVTKEEKKKLTADLANYWADSLLAQRSAQFGFASKSIGPPFFFTYKLKDPPILDSTNIPPTITYMNGYLRSQGYFYAQLQDTILKSFYNGQRRRTIVMTIDPGKQTIIDSENYSLATRRLQYLADSSKKSSLIQQGKSPFSKDLVGSELDRLVALYRQRGYFLLTRDNLIAEADTLDQSLMNFSSDPFEQAQKISEAVEHRKQHPSAVITIKQRENADSLQILSDSIYFKIYRVGNIYFYPEADIRLVADSVMADTVNMKKLTSGEFTMYYKKGLFRLKPLTGFANMHKNRLYNEVVFNQALSTFNQLPAWSQVDYRTQIRNDSVDFYFLLSPARRENITLGLEGSYNSGDYLSTGNLIGTAFNISYTNRNLFKSAVQSSTTFSNGVEFSPNSNYPFLQTFLSSLNQTFTIPNVDIPRIPFLKKPAIRRKGVEKISVSGNYSERNDFFRVRSLVASFGYEWRRRNNLFQWKPINIELYSLDTLPLLISAFQENPFLRSAFNTGSVISTQFAWTKTFNDKNNANNTNLVRIAVEQSYPPVNVNVYQYSKAEAEYRRVWALKKLSSVAFRFFSGLGYNYGSNPKFGNTLPFFKQFIAGGPNSMRAWGLRQLGLGSSVISDTSNFRERYGDMQLEANLEYRFHLATIGSVNIASAFFADAGNIWDIKKDAALPGAEFDISRLGKDIALGIGTGLRLDFSYFLIRLDFGLKVKDPARYENNGWMDFKKFTWQNTEYGVKDPTTGAITPLPRNNYAVQLGIGLPF